MENIKEPTTTLSVEEISTAPLAPAAELEAVCYNDDPRDPIVSFYDADPTNTQW